jgi:subtilisin family serine protease
MKNPRKTKTFGLTLSMLALTHSALAETPHPPPKPAIAPLIAVRYPNDADGDGIDDRLAEKARNAAASLISAATAADKSEAQARLSEMLTVELVFREPVTQQQLDEFTRQGGEITYIYKAVSYGWNGRIPLKSVFSLREALGAPLLLIEETAQMTGGMLKATSSGRVRPIWTSGFAGMPDGIAGDTNITIAIVDSGVDPNHPDLAGRGVYWADYTDEPLPGVGDPHGHGSRAAGVALGTGVASGTSAGPLLLSASDRLSSIVDGRFLPYPMELPTNSVTVGVTAKWNGGSAAGTRLYWLQRLKNGTATSWSSVKSVVGTSPLSLTATLTGLEDHAYSPGLVQSNGITDFVITWQVTNFPGSGDAFARLRGVAPACNWAAARTVRSNFTGLVSWSSSALDDLVANRIGKNIKIINLSISVIGTPGTNATFRQKINSTVNNGIVVVAMAGNDGTSSNAPAMEIDDPGRAALALTVAAANDINQLTDYSSHGFDPPGDGEDYKPDLMAPGGSSYSGGLKSVDSGDADGLGFPDQTPNDYYTAVGTSGATAFASGCAALVIDALQKRGLVWDFDSSRHALLVKMLLCATASESNVPREVVGFDPTLEKNLAGPGSYPVGKDPYEGYGMMNPDAAVEAVVLTCTNGITNNGTFGETPSDRRVWARTVNLTGGKLFIAAANVPGTGDYDLYLYSSQPSSNGTPVLLASSAQWGDGAAEALSYASVTNGSALLVVKRVSGSGTFSLVADEIAAPVITPGPADPNNFIFSFPSIAGRTYIVQYSDSLEDPDWQYLQSIPGDGTTKVVSDPLSLDQRFYRVSMQ